MKLRFDHGAPDTLKSLHPAYFALVMATGIVAIALFEHHIPFLPTLLFGLNLVFLLLLFGANVVRMRRYPAYFLADIRSHSRGVGFFTAVSAMGVVGSQIVLQFNAPTVAIPFWILTAGLWVVIMYGILTVLTVQTKKPKLSVGLNGSWLVSVVATQSLSILTALVLPAPLFEGLRLPLMFAALVLWLGGGVLYMWLMALVFFRYTFLPMSAQDLTPPYWINMGAVAISALAGAILLLHAPISPMVRELTPFIKGFTLLYWAVGSWWIPMLLLLGFWRYLIRGVPFSYDPLYWGGVFPLGMYSMCTYRLANMAEASFLIPLSHIFMFLALIAWLATFAGLVDSRLQTKIRVRGK